MKSKNKSAIFIYILFTAAIALFLFIRLYAVRSVTPETTAEGTIVFESTPPDVIPVSNTFVPSKAPTPSDSPDTEPGIMNDEWHGSFTPIKKFSGELPRIICWGDSLTETIDEKTAYPDVLRAISGCTVLNYGVTSESAAMIAMRQGGIGINVSSTIIPEERQMIPIFLKTESGGNVFLFDYGNGGGINPCTISDIEGELQQLNGAYYFTRKENGKMTTVSDQTPLITFGMKDQREDDVLVIFSGTNDMPDSDSVYDLIDTINKMLDYATSDKYIIVGLTYKGGMAEIDTVNDILSNEYGNHFLDIRTYLLNYGLEDANLTQTAQDKKDIENGEIPSSLRNDYVHGNKYFYDLLARQIYRRLQYLGYVPQE